MAGGAVCKEESEENAKRLSGSGSEKKFVLANTHLLAIQWGKGYLKNRRHQHLLHRIQRKIEVLLRVQGE